MKSHKRILSFILAFTMLLSGTNISSYAMETENLPMAESESGTIKAGSETGTAAETDSITGAGTAAETVSITEAGTAAGTVSVTETGTAAGTDSITGAETAAETVSVTDYDDVLDFEVVEVDPDKITGKIYTAEELSSAEKAGRTGEGNNREEPVPSVMSVTYGNYWDTYSNYYVYNQLGEDERKLWDAMEVMYSGYLEKETDLTSNYTEYVRLDTNQITKDELLGLVNMFKYCHPQYYFLMSGYSTYVGETYLIIAFKVYDAFLEGSARKAATNAIAAKLEPWFTAINEKATEEEKVKLINDLVCDAAYYNHAAVSQGITNVEQSEFTQSAYSLLGLGRTVCAGYTQTFTWLCNGAGIEAFGVSSSDHAWNKVKVNDDWYNNDCTWNDSDQGTVNDNVTYYNYYMRRDENMQMTQNSHDETEEWLPYLPECTLDSGSGYNTVGTLPVITARTVAPVINITKGSTSSTVEITSTTANAKIYYTLDGETPSESASKGYLYQGVFEINETATIRAIAVCNEYLDSDIVSGETEFIFYILASGNLGSNISWQLDSTGCLTLTGEGAMENIDGEASQPWAAYRDHITTVAIDERITSIGNYAFYGLKNLQSIDIPANITAIGSHGFYGSGLTGITIPATVNTLGDRAFSDCSALASAAINGNITTQGGYLFANCSALKNVTLSDDLETITNQMFFACTSLESVTLPANLKNIEIQGFAYCTMLKEIVIPAGVTTLTQYTFDGCDALLSVTIEGQISEISPHLFRNCGNLQNVTIPESVSTIQTGAFSGCTALGELYIPRGVTVIAQGALEQTTAIRGYRGSEAQNYANTYGNTFIEIEEVYFEVSFVTGTQETAESQECTAGTKISQPVLQKKTGYTLEGWYTSQEIQNETTKWDFANDTVTDNMTLYAKWTPNVYRVWFDANGGEVEITEKEVTYDEAYGELPTPVRQDYDFMGWYTAAAGGTLVSAADIVKITTVQTLYAHWQIKEQTAAPSADISSGSQVSENTLVTLSGRTAGVKIYYTTDSSIGMQLTPANGILYLQPIEITEDVTIYAMAVKEGCRDSEVVSFSYRILKFEVHFVTGTLEVIPSQEIAVNKKVAEPLLQERAGYSLDGWYTNEEIQDETTKWDFANDTVTERVIFYAKWIPNVYRIEFDANGGTVETTEKEVTYDGIYGELPVPIRENYNFTGWYTAKTEGSKIEASSVVKITEPQTLYARWQSLDMVMPPSADFPSGSQVETGTVIQLSSDTAGAKIYYTTDPLIGTGLTAENGILYQEPIPVREAVTIYTIAVKEGYKNSEVVAFAYTIKEIPKDWGDITVKDREEYGFLTPDDVPEELWVAGTADCDYSGQAVTFEDLHVYSHKTLLKSGTDYTVRYKNNLKAGTAAVIITGRGNYTGALTRNFRIRPLDLTMAEVLDVAVTYNGKVQKAATTVLCLVDGNVITLKNGRDYFLTYPKTDKKASDYDENAFKVVGKYTAAVTGKGNFTGSTAFIQTITDKMAVGRLKLGKIAAQQYRGAAVMPTVTLKNGSTLLTEGADYTVEYRNNEKIGTATLIITGQGEYTGQRAATFKITGTAIKKAKLNNFMAALPWTGQEVKQNATLQCTIGSGTDAVTKTLQEGTDYRIEYKNNVNTGTATIIYTGMGGFSGTLKKTYKIIAHDMNEGKVSIARIPVQWYTKNGTEPKPEVTYANGIQRFVLEEGKDYTLKYSNHKAVTSDRTGKTPAVTVTGKGNFKGKLTAEFTISGSDLSITTMKATDVVYKNKADICKPAIALYDTNGKKLTAGTDYDRKVQFTYTNDTTVVQAKSTKSILRKAGEAVDSKDIIPAGTVITATAAGIKNYGGTQKADFRYVEISLAKAKITVEPQTYSGKELEPGKNAVIVKVGKEILSENDYEIVGYGNNVKKGTGKITIRGLGIYGGEKTAAFKILSRSMNYTIIYDKNGADAVGTMKNSITATGKRLTANTYKRAGYEFVGWNTRADGSGKAYSDKEAFYMKEVRIFYGKRITLYAQWVKQ